jgi:hypothetical protein
MMCQKTNGLVVLRQNVLTLYALQITRVSLKYRIQDKKRGAALHDVTETKWVSDKLGKSPKNLSY